MTIQLPASIQPDRSNSDSLYYKSYSGNKFPVNINVSELFSPQIYNKCLQTHIQYKQQVSLYI